MQAKIYAGHIDRGLKKWLLKTGEERVDKCSTVRRLFRFHFLFMFVILFTYVAEFIIFLFLLDCVPNHRPLTG